MLCKSTILIIITPHYLFLGHLLIHVEKPFTDFVYASTCVFAVYRNSDTHTSITQTKPHLDRGEKREKKSDFYKK